MKYHYFLHWLKTKMTIFRSHQGEYWSGKKGLKGFLHCSHIKILKQSNLTQNLFICWSAFQGSFCFTVTDYPYKLAHTFATSSGALIKRNLSDSFKLIQKNGDCLGCDCLKIRVLLSETFLELSNAATGLQPYA